MIPFDACREWTIRPSFSLSSEPFQWITLDRECAAIQQVAEAPEVTRKYSC